MKPYKKSRVARTTTCRKEYKIEAQSLKERYGDEGITFYPLYRRGFRNKTKRLMSYKIRMYKTWKHNRKTQWKKK